jgi:hypothetical protein
VGSSLIKIGWAGFASVERQRTPCKPAGFYGEPQTSRCHSLKVVAQYPQTHTVYCTKFLISDAHSFNKAASDSRSSSCESFLFTRQATYVQRNVARSRNVYTYTDIPPAQHRFARGQHFCGDLMSYETIKRN